MKRFTFNVAKFITMAMVSLPVFCQTDILISDRSLYLDIGRGLQWGTSGQGGVNNNFLFSPYNPTVGTCIWMVNNNPTNAHSFTILAGQTADPSQTIFIGSTAKWATNAPQVFTIGVGGIVTNPVTLGPASITIFYIPSRGAAWVALQLSGSTVQVGTPDTLDMFATFTDRTSCNSLVNGPGDNLAASDNNLGTVRELNATVGTGSSAGFFGLLMTSLFNASSLNLGTTTLNTTAGSLAAPMLEEKSGRLTQVSNPAAGVQALVTRAAVAGQRHILDCVAFSAASSAAVAATTTTVIVLDGATNIWTWEIAVGVAAGAGIQVVQPHTICGLALVGTVNTLMTVGFNVGVAGAIEAISITGYNVQ